MRKVKEPTEAGALGDVYFITTQRVNLGLHQRDVSVVWDLAPHDLSILYYWLGEHACAVSVNGRGCIVAETPDVAFITLKFPSGVVALPARRAGRGQVVVREHCRCVLHRAVARPPAEAVDNAGVQRAGHRSRGIRQPASRETPSPPAISGKLSAPSAPAASRCERPRPAATSCSSPPRDHQ